MSPPVIALVGFLTILVLIGPFRMPIAIALLLVGSMGTVILTDASVALSILGSLPYEFSASWELSAAPAFLLMGSILYRGELAKSLYAAMQLAVGRLPGGLAVASNFACAVFAAACGSSVATTMAVGRFAIPEMSKAGYNKALAAAVCACAGTLGALIPPSIAMILYSAFTSTSLSALFAAGVLPGILTAAVYAVMIVARVSVNPSLAPRIDLQISRKEKLAILSDVWPVPLLIVVVIGSIYLGLATPTEAGSVGAVGAALIAMYMRKWSRKVAWESLTEAVTATASVFFVAIGAVVFQRFITISGATELLIHWINAWEISSFQLIIIALSIYLVLGAFLDPVGLALITLPIFIPAFEAHNVDLVWFGILMIKMLEIGLITPPVGLNVFAAKALVDKDVSTWQLFAGCGWFLVCELLVLALLVSFPSISLGLPRALGFWD